MPRVCTICTHGERAAIDGALVAGTPETQIAALFRVSPDAVARHKANHLPAALVKARDAEDITQAINIVQQLKAINTAALAILQDARQGGNHDIALRAIDRVQKQIELQARLIGELDDRPQVNLLIAPEWLAVRAVLLEALAPYPQARQAVVGRLAALDGA